MTAPRTITIGSASTVFYYNRTSSGTDGKYTVNPVTKERILNWNPYYMDSKISKRVFNKYGPYYPSDIPGKPGWTAADENAALGKLLEKVRGTDFDAGVFIGTGKQSLDTVFGTIGKLTRAAREVRHGNMAQASRYLGASPRKGFRDANNRALDTKDVASNWLELQYGWLPLLDDVKAAADVIELITQPPRKTVIHAKHKVFRFEVEDNLNWYNEASGTRIVKYSYEAKEQLSAIRQMNLISPGLLAWELLPYSFVVDWFIPIGTYISNYEQIPALKGRFMRTDYSFQTTVGYGKSSSMYYAGSRHETKSCILNRTTPATLEVPFPKFTGFGGLKNGKRLENALALFRLQFGSDATGSVDNFKKTRKLF